MGLLPNNKIMEPIFIRLIFNTLSIIFLTALPFLILYKWKTAKLIDRKIQTGIQTESQIKREILNGISTLAIFSLFGTIMYYLITKNIVRLETGFSISIIFQVLILLFFHDLYFYFIHRLMHTKYLFHKIHFVHHQSVSPTPFTSFSFHPYEAVLEILIFPILLLSYDWNMFAFILFGILSRILNITGHLGYDFFPKNQAKNKILKYLNTTIYHDLHHQKNGYNFGLYFNWWDRIFKTKDGKYEEYFAERKAKLE